MRRSARGAPAGRLRIPGGAHLHQNRRRVSGSCRVAAFRALSLLFASHPVGVGGAVPPRPGTGKALHGVAGSARIAALLGAGGRHAVQIPDVLRHHLVAAGSEIRRLAFGRPDPTARALQRRCGGDPPGTQLPARRQLLQARSQDAAPVPARRRHGDQRPHRTTLQ